MDWRDRQPQPWETLAEFVMRSIRNERAYRRPVAEMRPSGQTFIEPSWVVNPRPSVNAYLTSFGPG